MLPHIYSFKATLIASNTAVIYKFVHGSGILKSKKLSQQKYSQKL